MFEKFPSTQHNSHLHNSMGQKFLSKNLFDMLCIERLWNLLVNTLYNAFSANFCIAFLEDPLLLNTIPIYQQLKSVSTSISFPLFLSICFLSAYLCQILIFQIYRYSLSGFISCNKYENNLIVHANFQEFLRTAQRRIHKNSKQLKKKYSIYFNFQTSHIKVGKL